MIQDRKEYEVELTVTQRLGYKTFSRTPEEAISDAENAFEDGDRGFLITSEVEYSEAYPIGSSEDMEDDD